MNNLSIFFFLLQDEKAINPKVRFNTSCTLNVFSCVKNSDISLDGFFLAEKSLHLCGQVRLIKGVTHNPEIPKDLL